MIVLGLTGGMGMGKSTVAKIIRRHGFLHWDADLALREVYQHDVVDIFTNRWPSCVVDGQVDRKCLRVALQTGAVAMKDLEDTTRPFVEKRLSVALKTARNSRRNIMLDVPLLFESGWDRLCDVVMVVSCPAFIQLQRITKRDKRPPEEIKMLLSRQMSDREKTRRADVVIHTGYGRQRTAMELKEFFNDL